MASNALGENIIFFWGKWRETIKVWSTELLQFKEYHVCLISRVLKVRVSSIIAFQKSVFSMIPAMGCGRLMSNQWCWTCIFQLTCFSPESSILVKLCLFFFLIGSNWSLKVHYTVLANTLSNTIHLSHHECWPNFTGQGAPERSQTKDPQLFEFLLPDVGLGKQLLTIGSNVCRWTLGSVTTAQPVMCWLCHHGYWT